MPHNFKESQSASSGYRSYSEWIPHYLINRPRKFVKHCLVKLALGRNIRSRNIIVNDDGEITVKSEESHRIYKVVLDEDQIPK